MLRLEDSVFRIYFSTQTYSVFTEARHLLLLLFDLGDYLPSHVSLSGWTLVLPSLFQFRIASDLCFPTLNATDNKGNGKAFCDRCNLFGI